MRVYIVWVKGIRVTLKIPTVSAFCESSHDLANSQDDLRNALTVGILSVTLIPFTHTIYNLITHKIVRRLFRRKP